MEQSHISQYNQTPEPFESLRSSFDELKSFCDSDPDNSIRFPRDTSPVDDKSLIELKITGAIDYADVYTHIVGMQFNVFDHASYHAAFANTPRPIESVRKIGRALTDIQSVSE